MVTIEKQVTVLGLEYIRSLPGFLSTARTISTTLTNSAKWFGGSKEITSMTKSDNPRSAARSRVDNPALFRS
jgi:hypothetical protein